MNIQSFPYNLQNLASMFHLGLICYVHERNFFSIFAKKGDLPTKQLANSLGLAEHYINYHSMKKK